MLGRGMGVSPSLAALAGVAARIAALMAAAVLCTAAASAESIPGPPLAFPARDRAGEFCPPRASAAGHAAGFALGVAMIAIAARRREPGA
jgi:hypothetical protein